MELFLAIKGQHCASFPCNCQFETTAYSSITRSGNMQIMNQSFQRKHFKVTIAFLMTETLIGTDVIQS